ncbi:hypothetical protein [Demequina sp. NBRC 110055]|uniref:hypothetical protein n=1 Tax=Demequina sp. NBRC 110055 TaxID=1570344 RepID=UPI0009FECEF8|nr:hypothetical protein [Demequina sp. NBRC 110055]
MADATSDYLVLNRTKNTFTPKDESEPVTFFQALLFDVTTKALAVFRSKEIGDFDTLIAGEVVQDFEARVDTPTQIQATMLRPTSAGGFGGESF